VHQGALRQQLDYGKITVTRTTKGWLCGGGRLFPDDMPIVSFYQPTGRGLEAKIAEKLAHLRGLDAKAKNKKG